MKNKCLGVIETMGMIPAVEAADAGVKSANVSLISLENTSALITVVFEGDVGAVSAAISAGCSAAEKVGKVIGAHIIPRPSNEFKGFQKGSAYPFAAGKDEAAANEQKPTAMKRSRNGQNKTTTGSPAKISAPDPVKESKNKVAPARVRKT